MKKIQALVPQNPLEIIIFAIITLLIVFILFPEKFVEGSMPSIDFMKRSKANEVPKNSQRRAAFSDNSVSHKLSLFAESSEQSEHAEIPSVLTIFIMDENGDPTHFPADIIFESEGGQKIYTAIDGKFKLEVFQGRIAVRARFKKNGEFRVTLPVKMDIEPRDDEELDLMLIPALQKVCAAEFKSTDEGVKVLSSEPQSKLKPNDILYSIHGTHLIGMKLEQIDYLIGDNPLNEKLSVLVEGPDGSVKEMNFSKK